MAALLKHEPETIFINTWAEAGTFDLVVNSTVSHSLRRQRLDLLDVNCVLKSGRVTSSDMLDSLGLWTVRGETTEGDWLEALIVVRSADPEVELLKVMKLKRSEK